MKSKELKLSDYSIVIRYQERKILIVGFEKEVKNAKTKKPELDDIRLLFIKSNGSILMYGVPSGHSVNKEIITRIKEKAKDFFNTKMEVSVFEKKEF